MSQNKPLRYGVNNMYYAVKNDDGTYKAPVRMRGVRQITISAEGSTEKFYADNGVYYVINNNSGYTGELEIALITPEFATEILGEILDNNGVLVEKNDAEISEFALFFEFLGDKKHIRHVLYRCSCSRPGTESSTTEESTEVKTEKLSFTATALPTGLVKAKTSDTTKESVYNGWFSLPYNPSITTTTNTGNVNPKEPKGD